eukprot:scaffold22086_cov28-Tisochrysis_lutea.AAC.5
MRGVSKRLPSLAAQPDGVYHCAAAASAVDVPGLRMDCGGYRTLQAFPQRGRALGVIETEALARFGVHRRRDGGLKRDTHLILAGPGPADKAQRFKDSQEVIKAAVGQAGMNKQLLQCVRQRSDWHVELGTGEPRLIGEPDDLVIGIRLVDAEHEQHLRQRQALQHRVKREAACLGVANLACGV